MEWNIIEAKTTFPGEFPIEKLPNSLPLQVRIVKNKGRIGFEVGNISGIVPLENGDSLRILPKYKDINIVEMMLYVQGIDNKLKKRDLAKQYGLGDGIPKTEMFVEKFLKELRFIEGQSLKFERQKQQISINHVKGSVNWAKTILNIKKNVRNPVLCKVYFTNYDIPVNQLLGTAAKKCISYVEKYSNDWSLLVKWASTFEAVSLEELYRTVDRKLLQNRIGGARAYYANAIVIAKLILGYYGISTGDEIEGNALLVNTPSLYEEYIRVGCQNVLNSRGIIISKGFAPTEFLFNNGSCEVIPDIVFSKNNQVILVADVKYKEPESKDYYQMFSYAKKTGVKKGLIFSPCKSGEIEPSIKSRIAFDGTNIYDVTIPNSGTEKLENTIRTLYDKKIIPN